MGIVGALGLFVSIILHELGHAVVARRFDMPIREIVLFIFGGVAKLDKEPPNARAELLVAVGGPLVSAILAMIGFAVMIAVAGRGRVLEYRGPGVASLSAMDRHVIANMGTELGATSTVFPSDDRVRDFLRGQGREDGASRCATTCHPDRSKCSGRMA